jgi:hypothetical protein
MTGVGPRSLRWGGVRGAVLGLRFVLELCLLGALGLGGWAVADGGPLGALVGVAAAVVGAVIWGAWIAPRAWRRLPDPARFALETALFIVGAAALWVAWTPLAGVVFAAASIVVAALTRLVREPGSPP